MLIIDDDSESRQLTCFICSDIGMNVVAVVSFAALREISTHRMYDGLKVDVILLGLGRIDRGLGAVVRSIKEVKALEAAKIIALCSEPRKGDAQSARDEDIDGYISKPYTKDTLTNVIATALGDARPDGPIATRHLADELSCKGMRVLLAEDNSINIRLMEIVLQNLGCDFDVVQDGKAACNALKIKDYDVVLMDVHMPVMNGLDATRQIKEKINPRVPIIALTAAALQEEKAKCSAAGMVDIVIKPVRIDELRAKLQAWGNPQGSPIAGQNVTCRIDGEYW
ncbi:MAG: response regulator [Desulfobacteraceae bacterium]